MATASATISPATIRAATVISPKISSRRRARVEYITDMNSFLGARNKLPSLGLPVCSNQSFAKIVSSLALKRRGRGGSVFSTTCSAAEEIFRIAVIINGLVLVGVAVGFVLLRLEASLEEE